MGADSTGGKTSVTSTCLPVLIVDCPLCWQGLCWAHDQLLLKKKQESTAAQAPTAVEPAAEEEAKPPVAAAPAAATATVAVAATAAAASNNIDQNPVKEAPVIAQKEHVAMAAAPSTVKPAENGFGPRHPRVITVEKKSGKPLVRSWVLL